VAYARWRPLGYLVPTRKGREKVDNDEFRAREPFRRTSAKKRHQMTRDGHDHKFRNGFPPM